jgi:hypothetical protein
MFSERRKRCYSYCVSCIAIPVRGYFDFSLNQPILMEQTNQNSRDYGKKSYIVILSLLLAVSLGLWNCKPTNNSTASGGTQGFYPTDAVDSFPLTQQAFNTWFASGSVTQNGIVVPANSLAFNPPANANPNPTFYKWSAQMFLWITSNASSNGAGDNTVMAGSTFYTVTPPDSNNNRILVPHVPGTQLNAASHIRNARLDGANRVIVDKKGKKFVVIKGAGNTGVTDETGKTVPVKNVVARAGGGHAFIGVDGKELRSHKPILKVTVQHHPLAAEFKTASGKSIFLDAAGNEIDTEEGQATGDALISANGSLVYFITMVNDVYVRFLDTATTNTSLGAQFPTTQANLNSIYGNRPKPGDSTALAMELKTSWVSALSLGADSVNYIRISANVPVIDSTSTPNKWIEKDSMYTTRLALVGMHVVGSTLGHPEMIWATFEHQSNSPHAGYSYLDTAGSVKYVPQTVGGNWLFSKNASDPTPNASHISAPDLAGVLVAAPGFTISPSNTLRINAFGSFDIISPNPFDSPATSNSELITLNASIRQMLAAGDIRKNYFLIGATWTGGAGPSGSSYQGINTPVTADLAFGTSQLANSTMETYVLPINYTNGNNSFGTNMACFACHSNNGGISPASISHVFADLSQGLSLPQLKGQKLKSVTQK